jgi:hypothetical protein
VETKRASGWSPASSSRSASAAVFHAGSPRSSRDSGTVASSRALLQSAGSKSSPPVLPDTVPSACENPAWLTANNTRVCTGSSA